MPSGRTSTASISCTWGCSRRPVDLAGDLLDAARLDQAGGELDARGGHRGLDGADQHPVGPGGSTDGAVLLLGVGDAVGDPGSDGRGELGRRHQRVPEGGEAPGELAVERSVRPAGSAPPRDGSRAMRSAQAAGAVRKNAPAKAAGPSIVERASSSRSSLTSAAWRAHRGGEQALDTSVAGFQMPGRAEDLANAQRAGQGTAPPETPGLGRPQVGLRRRQCRGCSRAAGLDFAGIFRALGR